MLKVLKVGGLDSLVRHAAFFSAWSPHASPVLNGRSFDSPISNFTEFDPYVKPFSS